MFWRQKWDAPSENLVSIVDSLSIDEFSDVKDFIQDSRKKDDANTQKNPEHHSLFNSRVNVAIDEAIEKLSEAKTENVLQVASIQLEVLNRYYEEILTQAKRSFTCALVFSALGSLAFFISVFFVFNSQSRDKAWIPLVGGAVIEVISGINYVLYNRASQQASSFHSKLDIVSRFLIANSFCESLEERTRDETRSKLISVLVGQPESISHVESQKLGHQINNPEPSIEVEVEGLLGSRFKMYKSIQFTRFSIAVTLQIT